MITFITKPIKSLSAAIAQSSNSLMYIIIGIIVTLGPVFFFPIKGLSIIASKGYFIAFCTLIGLLIVGITTLKRGSFSLPKHIIFVTLGGISLISLICGVLADSSLMSLVGYGFETTTWFFVASLSFLVLLAYKTIADYDRIALTYGGMFLGFLALLLIHVIRFIAGPATANLGVLGTTTSTLIGSWMDLGIFAGVVLLISVIALELAGLVRMAWLITLVTAIASAVLLLVMNIGIIWIVLGFVSLVLTLYLFAFAYWDSRSKSYRHDKRAPWFVLILFITSLIGIFFGGVFNALASKHQPLPWNEIRPSVVSTLSVAKKVISHNALVGYGPNTFILGWNMAKPPALSGNTLSEADFSLGYSYITTQMATGGILGATLWLVLVIVIVFAVLKRMAKGFESAIERFFVTSLGVGVLFLVIMASVSVPGAYLLALLAILVGGFMGTFGVAEHTHKISFIKDPRTSFFGILAITALILATLLGTYIFFRKVASFAHDMKGLSLVANQKLAEGATEINLAARYASHDLYHIQLAQFALSDAGKIISTLTDANKQTVSSQAEQVLGIALGHAKAATIQNSFNYKNWLLLGNVYRAAVSIGVKDAFDLAKNAYAEAEKRNPSDSTMKLAYANLALANRDVPGALQYIKDSVDAYPTRDAYLLRAQIQIGQQKWGEVVASLKQAIMLDQSNAALYVYLGAAYEKSGDTVNANKIYDLIRKQFQDGDQAINQIKQAFSINQTVTQPDPSSITPVPVKPVPQKTVAPKKKR